MSDPVQKALEEARVKLRGSPGHVQKKGRIERDSSSGFVEHGRPHLVTFAQDVRIRVQPGRKLADGSFAADGPAREEFHRAGEIVQREAGIWRIEVLEGTAEFEKDFQPPASSRGEVPMV